MLKTLRNRLILSHVLPLLIVIPITGLVLIYLLETQVLIPQMSKELASNARLLAEFVRNQPQIWQNPAYAQQYLLQSNPNTNARAMLLYPNGRLLASTDPRDIALVDQTMNIPNLAGIQKGQMVSKISNSQNPSAEIIDIYVPVLDNQSHLLGIVRMTYRLSDVSKQFDLLRYLIVGILLICMIAGAVLGYILALSIASPIQQVTQAVYDLAYGDINKELPEHGPEEIRRLTRSVNFLSRRFQHLESTRKQLIANLIHELGRPLGALRAGILALIRGAAKDDKTLQEYLGGMDDETARLQRLLDDLMQMHERLLGNMDLDYQPIHPNDWLPKVLSPWKPAADEKHLIWKVNMPKDLPVIRADPDRLAQIVGNLVSNAIKFTPQNGTVTTSVGVEDHELWIRVSDTGPGIPPDEQEKIFLPFYRGKQGGRLPQGLGLGLGIARELAVSHGGRLDVASEPGAGSRFTVWIPIRNGTKPT